MIDSPLPFALARSERNFYADSGLDRVSEQRRDSAWITEQLLHPNSRFVPVWRSRNLVDPARAEVLYLGQDRFSVGENEPVLLGVRETIAYFAVDLSHIDGGEDGAALASRFAASAAFLDLRIVGPQLPRREGGLLAYARGMLTWHRRHRFCGQCGAPTIAREGGHLRVCTNQECGLEQFPRTDPAVIMLVTCGERCLLARQARFPPGMYSTLAGFVEPGETLEAAVAREVWEEAGVRVRNVRYHSSQPWPFPTSLMLGFYADADTFDCAINRSELEDGGWYARAWIRERSDAGDPTFKLPRADSIARRLIEDWLEPNR
jgi:NAD+ diphosphatase